MIKALCVLFFVVLMNVCYSSEADISRRQEIAYQVINKFASKWEDKGFILEGIGGASKENRTTGFEMLFQTASLENVQEARRILLNLVADFIKDINENIALRAYLYKFPYPIENISIGILSANSEKEPQSHLCSVSLSRGNIFYRKETSLKDGPSQLVLEETYEEALKIVAAYKEGELNSIAEYQALSK